MRHLQRRVLAGAINGLQGTSGTGTRATVARHHYKRAIDPARTQENQLLKRISVLHPILRHTVAAASLALLGTLAQADTARVKAETKVILQNCLAAMTTKSLDTAPFLSRGYSLGRKNRLRLEVVPTNVWNGQHFNFELQFSDGNAPRCDASVSKGAASRSEAQAQEDALRATTLDVLAAAGYKRVQYQGRRNKMRIGWQRGDRILRVSGNTQYGTRGGGNTVAKTFLDVSIVQ